VKKIHVWQERRAAFGELVMQDSSPFRWLEDRGPTCQLIAVIDDATSRIHARFTEHDTTEENLRTLGGWIRRYGRPLAHYTDKASIFRKAGPQPLAEQLRGDALRTQFGRALHELGIEWIAAHSPQAKGRIVWLIIVAYPLWSKGGLAGSPAEGITSSFLWVILPIVAVPMCL
jgi:hypothetical protein